MKPKAIAWRQRKDMSPPSSGGENLEPETGLCRTDFDAAKAGCDQAVRAKRERCWREEHVAFIAAYNSIVDMEGFPLEQWPSF